MIVVLRVMPEDGEVEYSQLEETVKTTVQNYGESVKIRSVEAVGVGFGLQACVIDFQVDETLGIENLENQLADIEIIGEVNVEKMDRL